MKHVSPTAHTTQGIYLCQDMDERTERKMG